MQDNTGACCKETKEVLETLAIVTVNWPPHSRDLNPVETLWRYMKAWLQSWYGDC